jgi:hypothetical protein
LACTANIGLDPAAARALLCKQQEAIPETITQGIVFPIPFFENSL